jgi:hypothetical protein
VSAGKKRSGGCMTEWIKGVETLCGPLFVVVVVNPSRITTNLNTKGFEFIKLTVLQMSSSQQRAKRNDES